MEYGYITFRSVTHAQQGERVLHRGGLRCHLRRTPRWLEEQGCGYCLVLRPGALSQAAAMLRRSGVTYRRIWLGEGEVLREAEI